MSTPWLAVLYLHLVAMAFFAGGQIMLAAAIVPVERRNPDPARMREIARRFGSGPLAALVVLAATGGRDGVAVRPFGTRGRSRSSSRWSGW